MADVATLAKATIQFNRSYCYAHVELYWVIYDFLFSASFSFFTNNIDDDYWISCWFNQSPQVSAHHLMQFRNYIQYLVISMLVWASIFCFIYIQDIVISSSSSVFRHECDQIINKMIIFIVGENNRLFQHCVQTNSTAALGMTKWQNVVIAVRDIVLIIVTFTITEWAFACHLLVSFALFVRRNKCLCTEIASYWNDLLYYTCK
jgi:hypothetical protein